MESLIYSNSIPFKLKCNSPRIARFDSIRKLTSPPFPPPDSSRFSPLSAGLQPPNCVSSEPIDECPARKSWFSVGTGNEVEDKSRFLILIAQKLSQRRKVFTIGKVLLISTIVLASLHPAFTLPAFASFLEASKARGAAAVAAGSSLVRHELFSSAWTGFLAGCLHTLSGPDHLAALAPLSIGRTRMESAAVGVLWGCGHDAGQVIFGLIFLLLKDQLHIEVIRAWGTRVVGVTLLVIGAMGIREASGVPAPYVLLENSEYNIGRCEPIHC